MYEEICKHSPCLTDITTVDEFANRKWSSCSLSKHEFSTANNRQLQKFIYIYNYNNKQCNCSQCAQNQQCTICKVICILCSQVYLYLYHLLACTAASRSVITDRFTIVRISSEQFYSQLPDSSNYSAMPTCVATKMDILMLFTPL